jgi:oxaloacetate decarboxylase alpha subunit
MSEIRFVDTTVRDGNQSLWALNMRTGMILPVASQMDQAGFEAMEFFVGGVHMRKLVRELREDPWQWIKLLRPKFTATPLRHHGGLSVGGFEKIPRSVQRLLLERMVAYGIRYVRTSDPWNDPSSWKREIGELREIGMDTIMNLVFTVSPRHTDEYYAERTRALAALKPYRICLKDVGGLMTPERARTLIPIVLQNSDGIPVEFHAHCSSGLAPLCCLEAIKLGIKTIHTAIPPLADGSSQPSIFNVARNARAIGFTPVVDEEALKPVSEHFTWIARREGLPVGAPVEYDYLQYLHQIPGGMISNLRHQLRLVGMENRVEEVLEEAVQVRANFGYPIMITPLSQFVGSQAAMNVIVGERYKEVADQTIQYALGLWGMEAISSMDPDVRDKILSRPRAKEWARWEVPEPSIQEVRRQFEGAGISDEELLLRIYAGGEEAVKAMRAAGPPKEYLDARRPLIKLIGELTRMTEFKKIYIRKGELSLMLGKNEINSKAPLASPSPGESSRL